MGEIAKAAPTRIRELGPGTDLDDMLRQETEPFVIRGIASDWPLVRAGKQSPDEARSYLLDHARDRPFTVNIGEPAGGDMLFYNAEMQMNFRTGRASLADIFGRLEDNEGREDAPVIYLSSIDMVDYFDGLDEANRLDLGTREPLASIWIGNRTRVAPHNDVPNNVAVCAVGSRRFTLFPPEQFANLYLGPIDHTPAGRPVSMVDLSDPDLARFPRIGEALAQARIAELQPGDAIFIPSLWWHQVEALGPFNILVNYWWRDVPRYLGNPQDALHHAMLSIRDLDPSAKRLWKAFFDHYVFENGEDVIAHIPEGARGVLDPLDAEQAGKLRANILHGLSR
jgi:cupin-like protein